MTMNKTAVAVFAQDEVSLVGQNREVEVTVAASAVVSYVSCQLQM